MKITIYKIFDFILIGYIAIYAVFSQQAGPLAQYMMHLSTGCLLICGLFLILERRKTILIPMHAIWYMGFVVLIAGNALITNTSIAVDNATILRILFISFLITVRILGVNDVLCLLRKIAWCGVFEIFLLVFAISAESWKAALFSRGRLGIGEIELNVCALLLACSAMSCIFVWNITRQRSWLVLCLCEIVVLMMFQSRTGIFSLAIGMLFYFGTIYGINRRIIKNTLVVLGIMVIGILLIVTLKNGDIIFSRLFLYDDSIKYRLQIVEASIDAWCEMPIFGHGLSAIQEVMLEKIGYPFAAHNNIAGLAVGTGCIGILYYYTFLITIVIKMHSLKGESKLESAAKSFMVVGIFSDLSCENYRILVSQVILALAIAMMLALKKYDCENAKTVKTCNR